jgi:hypothetical protein
MVKGICFTYSELFDRQPTMEELTEVIKRLPLRHAAFVLSRINLLLRCSMQEKDQANFGKVQESLVVGPLNDETLGLLKQRFPTARCDERPVFLPQRVLTVLRLAVSHCDPEPVPKTEEDEFVRYTIGHACLMMNNLLFTPAEEEALRTGPDDDRRIELMVQMMAGFELTNPQKAHHLRPRLQLMYRMLLKDPRVQSRIALQCEGFDFESEFHALVGVSLDHWVFIVFAMYAYFLEGAKPSWHRGLGSARPAANLCAALPFSRRELEQIQFLLGHRSVETTERYLESRQRLVQAVNDHLGIEPEGGSS